VRRRRRGLREPISGLTHLAGGLLALVGMVVLVAQAVRTGEASRTVAFAIYGLSLVALYAASALYHLLPVSERGVARLRRLDHAMIFVLIAGTYTPVCLLMLDGGWRVGMLGLVWGLALCGVLLKIFWIGRVRLVTVSLYLGMGWAALISLPALLRAVPAGAVVTFLAGGLIYSAGAAVYALKKPDPFPGVFGFHEVWHLFVLAGSACHFAAMLLYVAPA
jgi:hemolysin III